MRSAAIVMAAVFIHSGSAFAFDESKAARLVRDYSETIACQTEDTEYKAVKVVGSPSSDEMFDQYVVHWYGDVGCSGGNGTIVPNFTVVEMRAFRTPVVLPNYKIPQINIIQVTSFSGSEGRIFVEGLAYGPNDGQHRPTKKMSYTLKLDLDGFVVERRR